MKKILFFSLLITASICVEMLISPIRGYKGLGFIPDSAIGFFVYLLVTWFFLKKYGTNHQALYILSAIAFGLLILNIPGRIIYYPDGMRSFPDFLMHFLGIFAGYFFYKRKTLLHKLNFSVSILIILFTYFYGYNLWLNNINFGTITGNVYFKAPALNDIKDKNNNLFFVQKNKIVVINFWFIGCGPCLREFPQFQKICSSFKVNPNIQFFSVNVPTQYDKKNDPFNYLTGKGYSFDMAVCNNIELINKLQIKGYPTIIILDSKGYVVYKGDIVGVPSKIKSLL